MIKCNLATLLAERGLRITKVSNDTGISRTTLTALSNNTSKGIQFDTINKLCQYLKINVNTLFIFHPSEINYIFESVDEILYIDMTVKYRSLIYKILLETCIVDLSNKNDDNPIYDLTVFIMDGHDIPTSFNHYLEFDYGNEWFETYYFELPIIFRTDFEATLLKDLQTQLNLPTNAKINFNVEKARLG